MCSFFRLSRLAGCAGLLLLPHARALTVSTGNGDAREGVFSSAAIVDGNPAIAWTDDKQIAIRYARSLELDGMVWSAPVTIDTGTQVGGPVSLVVTGGNPAVCYFDSTAGKLKFARASDPTGATWAPPAVVPAEGLSPAQYIMAEIAGKPAICYRGGCCQDLMFLRATDSTGSAWESPVTVAPSTGIIGQPFLMEVQGLPAVAWSGGAAGVSYIRATDPAGTLWAPSALVSAFTTLSGVQMAIVNGRPTMTFRADDSGVVFIARAKDAWGLLWGPPAAPDGLRNPPPGTFCSLAAIQGRPALACYTGSPAFDLIYTRAVDENGDGSGSWPAPVAAATIGDVGKSVCLFEVHGNPAMAYHNTTKGSVEYQRALVSSGNARWRPELVVSSVFPGPPSPLGLPIPNGGTLDFGKVTIGGARGIPIRISNPNSGADEISILNLQIDGPNAVEFVLTIFPRQTVIHAGESVVYRLEHRPLTSGSKSAVLQILTSEAGAPGVYTVNLSGNSNPAISLAVADGSTILIPAMPPGRPADLPFVISNPGFAPLQINAVTIDGPDAAAFSIGTPLPFTAEPGNTAVLALHHLSPGLAGKSASIHIGSNATEGGNPYNVTVTTALGLLDPTFKAFSDPSARVAVQTNGTILAAGPQSLGRFLPDGSRDATFFQPTVDDGVVACVAALEDGGFLVAGTFRHIGGNAHAGVVKLNPDGSPDEAFNPPLSGDICCVAPERDGSLLLGGSISLPAPAGIVRLARVHADGSIDSSFHPSINDDLYCIAVESDGRILIGGRFTAVSGQDANHIARLNSNGTPAAFSSTASGEVHCLAVQADGTIFAGGPFASGIVRLRPDGSRDSLTMAPADTAVKDLLLQVDGKCTAAGNFSTIGHIPRKGFCRFNADGTLDATFNPDGDVFPFGGLEQITAQADGSIIAAPFPGVGNDDTNLVRLVAGIASSVLVQPNRSTLHWMRSGSAPELSFVWFELRTPSSPGWTPLGPGIRIPGGWELAGLDLPGTGTLRARGRCGGSLVESVAPLLSPLEVWRVQYFGDPANSGDSADSADPDGDGLTNFVEFAFGLSPVESAMQTLPEFLHRDGAFTSEFTVPESAVGAASYAAEWSSNMLPGTWNPVPDTGSGGHHIFTASGNTEHIFVRFIVKAR